MNLKNCPLDVEFRLEKIDLDGPVRFRLRELGLTPGATVKVTHKGGFGGRVVAIKQQRFALDSATACRLHVADTVASPIEAPIA